MDALLHSSFQLLCFLIAPIAMILEITFVASLRRNRSRFAQTAAPASTLPEMRERRTLLFQRGQILTIHSRKATQHGR
jgi:hypothetical protein